MKKFKDKYGPWVLVTGATSGIGASFSQLLAEIGLNLVIVARSSENLNTQKKLLEMKYGVNVKAIPADLSNEVSCAKIEQETSLLDIGLLIANAGVENNGLYVDNQLGDEKKLLALNAISPMMLSHIFAKRFIDRKRGGILFVSSLFGYQGVPYVANYSASKAYILSLGESLNVELKPFGVDVTVLSPGLTKTPMTENMTVDFSKIPITSHSPDIVAKVGLKALGKKATVVPGLINKIYAWENRLIPRSWPVKLFGFLVKRARTTENKSVMVESQ